MPARLARRSTSPRRSADRSRSAQHFHRHHPAEAADSGAAAQPRARCCFVVRLRHQRGRDRARAARRARPRSTPACIALGGRARRARVRSCTSRCASSPRGRPVHPADRDGAQRPRHRRDLPHRHRRRHLTAGTPPACARSSWTAIAIVIALGVLLLIRNHRVLQRYRYIAMFTGIVLLLLPMLPGIGSTESRRAPLDRARRRSRSSPASSRRSPSRSSSPATWCAPRHPLDGRHANSSGCGSRARATSARSSSSGLLSMAVHRLPARPRNRAALLRPVPRDDLRRDRAGQLGRARPRACSSAAPSSPAGCSATSPAASTPGSTPSTRRSTTRPAAATSSCRACSVSPTAASSAPASARAAPTSCRWPRATTSSPASARSSASPACSRSSRLYLLFVSRGFRIGFAGQDDFGRLLGVGLSFVVALQVLHRGRRRHPGHPADRTHHAVPRRGRLLARRQLDHRRPAAAALRRRAQPAATGGRADEPRTQARQHRRAAHVPRPVRARPPIIQVVPGGQPPRPTPATRARSTTATRSSAARSSSSGQPIAESVPVERRVQVPARLHATPELYSAVTGYFTLNQGNTGIEGALNDYLSGTANDAVPRPAERDPHRPEPAGRRRRDHHRPGRAAGRLGCPRRTTGRRRRDRTRRPARILAMVSKPDLRPEPARRRTTRDTVDRHLQAAARRPRRPADQPRDRRRPEPARAPTFKLVVASAALDSGKYTPRQRVPEPGDAASCPAATTVDQQRRGRHLRRRRDGDDRRPRCACSCNIPFAELGAAARRRPRSAKQAEAFGFDEQLVRSR